MAYVREQVIHKGGRTYRYYQLVRGYRENGKVKIELVKHLGRFDSIEQARATAGVVTNSALPELRRLLEKHLTLTREWDRRHREHGGNDGYYERQGEKFDLHGDRSQHAVERRAAIAEIEDYIYALEDERGALKDKAREIYASLPKSDQRRARQDVHLANFLGVEWESPEPEDYPG